MNVRPTVPLKYLSTEDAPKSFLKDHGANDGTRTRSPGSTGRCSSQLSYTRHHSPLACTAVSCGIFPVFMESPTDSKSLYNFLFSFMGTSFVNTASAAEPGAHFTLTTFVLLAPFNP